MRCLWLGAFGCVLIACEGGDIALFSAAQAGAAGVSGLSDSGGSSDAGVSDAGGSSSVTDAGGASGSGGTSGACFNNKDCASDSFCSKSTCNDAQGVCAPLAFPDDSSNVHVCGCDNVTYWNDSYRKYYGVASSSTGICMQRQDGCMRDEDCPNHGLRSSPLCAHLLPPNAPCGSPSGPGLCWIIPNPCPTTDVFRFQLCATGGCATTCNAVASRSPFVLLPQSQTCP